jgi:hypothetical protein
MLRALLNEFSVFSFSSSTEINYFCSFYLDTPFQRIMFQELFSNTMLPLHQLETGSFDEILQYIIENDPK